MKSIDVAIGLFIGLLAWLFMYHLGVVRAFPAPGKFGFAMGVVIGILAYCVSALVREGEVPRDDDEWRGI